MADALTELLDRIRGTETNGIPIGEGEVAGAAKRAGRELDRQAALSGPGKSKELLATERQQAKLGAPLDVATGAPFLQRVGAAFRTEPDQVVKYWQDLYGKDNVRVLDDGELAVKTQGDNGKPKFLKVDEDKLTLKDLDTVIGSAPEIASAILAMRAGARVMPSTRFPFARDLVTGALGGQTAHAMKDIAVRGRDDQLTPTDLSHVGMNAIKGTATDLMLGAGLGAGAKIVGKVITPFGESVPKIQYDAMEAAKYWESKGVTLPYSAGEKTGSVFLQRSEAELKKLPGASGPFDDLRDQQQAAIQQMQEIVQGVPHGAAIPSVEYVTERVQQAVRGQLEPAQQAIVNARTKLVDDAHNEALKIIESQTFPVRQDDAATVGAALRNKIEAIRNDFTDQSARLYNAARAMPGGTTRILVPGTMATEAATYLRDKLPPIKEFVPAGVVDKLKALANAKNTKFSLQDLISMRNEVDNAIAEGEAIPGVRTHHLAEIRKMITGGIKQGVNSIPTSPLKNAYEAAETFYKDNVSKFHTKLISTALKDQQAPGAVGDAALFRRIVTGEDKIDELKSFLGANSPEFGMLKRGIADEIYRTSRLAGQDTLDARKFLNSLDSLRNNQPTVFKEVFGTQGNNILRQAQLMDVGQSAKIEQSALEHGFKDPSAITELRDLVNAQRAQDKLYKNKILSAIGSKTLPGDGIDPNQFVNRFVDSATPQQVKQVMEMVEKGDPGAAWQLRAKAVQKLLMDAERKPGPLDKVALRLDEGRTINTDALQGLMRDPEKRKVYEAMIGADGIQSLDMLAKALKPIEAKDRAFAAAGGISAGMQIGKFWQGGLFGFADKALHNLLGGFLLTAPAVRQWAGNNVMTPERVYSLAKTTLYSVPVIDAIQREYGNSSPQVYQKLNDGLDAWMSQQATTNDPKVNAIRALERLATPASTNSLPAQR